MRSYMIRRLGHSFFILLGVMALLFFAFNVLGDPVELLVDEEASEEIIQAMREKYGYDRPVYVQFADYFGNLLTFDFGVSLRFRIGAGGMVAERLPNTFALGLVAWGLGSLGIPLGILAARRPRGIVDRIVNILSFAVISIPDFWLSLMLILVVSVQFGFLPTSGFDGLGPEVHHPAGARPLPQGFRAQRSNHPSHHDRRAGQAVCGYRKGQRLG